MAEPEPELSLSVFVIGLSNSFPVDIGRSKTVGHLSEAILLKRPNALKGIDAAELVLYKVEIPDGEDLEQLAPQARRQKLEVQSRKLLNIFRTTPPEEVVSILVEVPVISE